MSGIATAVVGASVITGYMGSRAQAGAASDASQAQQETDAAQIAESKRQFDTVRELLRPYSEAGTGALAAQQNLIGLGGPDAQKKAIAALSGGPEMQAMTQQGEEAMRANASATGGLRGGNLQSALAKFRPQMLSNLINQQYERLGGLTTTGQNAAAGTGSAAQTSGGQIIQALGESGAARAGEAMAAGNAQAGMWGGVGSTVGTLGTLKLMGKF